MDISSFVGHFLHVSNCVLFSSFHGPNIPPAPLAAPLPPPFSLLLLLLLRPLDLNIDVEGVGAVIDWCTVLTVSPSAPSLTAVQTLRFPRESPENPLRIPKNP